MIWYDSHARTVSQRLARWQARDEPAPGLPLDQAIALQLRIIGDVVLPGDPDYDRDRMLSNPRFDHFPKVIVYCVAESDVRSCLELARAAGLAVVVRSGGHSTGGFSSEFGMLLDVSRMNDVHVDPATCTARAGPGTQFRKFNAKLESYKLHTPGGACPDVCVGGYMQGGGYGFTARIFGMNCDQVESVRVMLADGRIVHADREVNRDLFWAVRGGTGSNFGVLLEASYRLYEGCDFSGFSIRWMIDSDAGRRDAAAALDWLQRNFMRTGAPAELGYQVIWVFEGPEDGPKRPQILMRGMYRGPLEALEAVLALVLALAGAEMQALYPPQPYTQLNETLLTQPYEVPEFPADMTPMPPPEAKLSRYIGRPVGADGWQGLMEYFCASPSPYTTADMEIYGGAIGAVRNGANAFLHRDADFDLFLDVFWTTAAEEKEMLAYIDGWEAAVAPHWDGEVYQNYPRPVDPDFGRNYWGDFYPALRAVKSKYDPFGLFRYPQSIAPLVDGETPPDLDGLKEAIVDVH
ncbi:FAD-dependent oxidoreductase [Acidimangrovimonas pyrenivorans]|uniref:FAD-dependent oxidoreductase n=1 Tax=Acidimangrovimonas pyrenivorans TaxID=2030798 RepID=A0ABV7AHU7_9RHOB